VNLIIFLNKCGLLLGNHEWILKQIQMESFMLRAKTYKPPWLLIILRNIFFKIYQCRSN